MTRTKSPCLVETPAVGERPSRAYSKPPRRVDTARHHRNGVPLDKSQRLHLEVPVRVYNLSSNKEPKPLLEAARALVLYAHGALLDMDAPVEPGQELLLVNPKNEVKAACRVAGFEPKKNGCKSVVRVEFTQAASRFWGVVFPSEDWDPIQRKQPRAVRRSSRIKCSQPVRVRPAEESASDFSDVCSTQNISPDSVYFHSGHLGYHQGMRLTITFLSDVDFFAPHTNYTGEIVRVDRGQDGPVGVAVKLFGRANLEPPTTLTSSRANALPHRIGQGLALVPSHLCHWIARNGVRIVCWLLSYLGKISRLLARRAKALM